MKLLKYPFSIFIICVIFFLCVMKLPDETPPALRIPYLDKIVHVLMYFGLTGILFVEYFKLKQGYSWKQTWSFLIGNKSSKALSFNPIQMFPFFIMAVISLAYGGIIEIIQENFTPMRSGDWIDFLADGIGIAIALITFFIFNKIRIKQFF